MSTSITSDDKMPLYLGLGVVVIILIAFFSKGDESSAKGKKKAIATSTDAAPTTTTSKKSKKKKSSKAKAASSAAPPAEKKAERKVVIQEDSVPKPEAEPSATKTSKKKKKKNKKGGATSTAKTIPSSPIAVTQGSAFANDDDDESDDDLDFTLIQSVSKRKGANDATKRAAANKERDRVRALKRSEEKAKAEAAATAEAKAAAQAVADADALTRKEQQDAAMQSALASEAAAEEKKKSEAAAKGGKNGASVSANGESAPAATDEKKKKRKKKKKKGAAALALEESARPVLVKPATPSGEQWETVPLVEEWNEVSHKKAKQKAKMDAAAAEAEANPSFLMDSDAPVDVDEEAGEISVTVAAGDDPLIFIGKGGSTIQHLQQSTGARFNLDRVTKILTISGAEDCVQAGVVEAQAILAIEAERKANETEERVTWGSDAIKAVIGRGGSNIRATQDATGVRIDADVEAGTLVIVGPADDVSTALTMCHNAAFGEVQDVLELGTRNAVNLVYGPSFQTIRSLQDTTGCKLDITRGSTTLKLAGSSEAVAEATAQIRTLLEANRGFEMTIENSKVGAVYGKGGETLRSIQDRTGTQIDVTRGPTHATVSVMGTVESSSRARNMLQHAIDGEVELQPGEVAEEIELGSATAAVIGRRGSNVAELEKRHGVKINVRSELQKARVVGKPDAVAAAVKDITAIAKPIMDAEAAQKKADEAQESGESAWQVDVEDDDADGW